MDDYTIELIIRGAGIDPNSDQGRAYKAALRRQMQALNSTAGEDTRRWDITSGQAGDRITNDRDYQMGQLRNSARDMEIRARDIEQRYQIAKRSAQNDEERTRLDRWKAERDNEIQREKNRLDARRVELEAGRLGLDTELGRGRLGLDTELGRGRLGLDTELGRGDLALRQGQFANDILKTQVDLNSQVRNWGKVLDYRQGIQSSPMAVGALRGLLSNGAATGNNPTFVTPQGLPQQNSMAAVLADMGAGQAASNAAAAGSGAGAQSTSPDRTDPRVAGIQAILKNYQPSDDDGVDAKDMASMRAILALAAQGTQKTANRTGLMDEDEQQFIAGGMDRIGLGGDWWLRQQDRQRVGNAASGRAA